MSASTSSPVVSPPARQQQQLSGGIEQPLQFLSCRPRGARDLTGGHVLFEARARNQGRRGHGADGQDQNDRQIPQQTPTDVPGGAIEQAAKQFTGKPHCSPQTLSGPLLHARQVTVMVEFKHS